MLNDQNLPDLSCVNIFLISKLQGHEGNINSVSFNPVLGLKQIATASNDSSIMLCNIDNVRAYKFSGHKGAVLDVCFSPGGKLFASASLDKSVRLWCPDYKKNVSSTEFKAHTAPVRSVSFSPDGQKMVTCSDDKTVKVWLVCKQKFLFSLSDHTNWVRCAKISPDEKIIASASDDKTVRVYDFNSLSPVTRFSDFKASVNHIDFHPSSMYIAAAYGDGSVKLFDMRMQKLVQLYTEHDKKANRVCFHPSGNLLLSCSDDKKINVMDLREALKICSVLDNKSAVLGLSFSKDGKHFASGGAEKHLFVFENNFHELQSDFVDIALDSSLSIPNKVIDKSKSLDQKEQGHSVSSHCNRISNEPDLLTASNNPEKYARDVLPTEFSSSESSNMNAISELHSVIDSLVSEVDLLTQTVLMLGKRLSIIEAKLHSPAQFSSPLETKLSVNEKYETMSN